MANRVIPPQNPVPSPVTTREPLVHWLDTTPVDSDDRPCSIGDLRVEARVSGLYARVDETMRIDNPNRRPISVDVSVLMPDDAVVCGYALEIGDQMVDGVVVPKEKARVAFETERRRGVDPGLVEAVRGNIYKTRVYPVPAMGNRSIRLSYVAPLSVTDGSVAACELPLPADRVLHQSFRIEVECPDAPRAVVTGLGDGTATEVDGAWLFEFEGASTSATEPVRITVPSLPSPLVTVERDEYGDLWFSASETIPEETPDGDVPSVRSLVVLWDASGSRSSGSHEDEIRLVRSYASGDGIESLSLVTFADGIRDVTACESADDLAEAISAVRYDGGTNIRALMEGLETVDGATDGVAGGVVCVLFSDGIDTLSGELPELPDGCDMLAVVGGSQRDFETLRQACRGHAFDVAHAPADAHGLAIEFSSATSARRLAVSGTGIADACDAGIAGSGRRGMIGRLTDGSTEIRLGDGGNPIAVPADVAKDGRVLSRAWAARRVSLLSPRADDNTDELMSIGRRFGVASPVSSLLVLETLDQWLRYDVRPPESWPSMREEWDRLQEGGMRLSSDDGDKARHLAAVEREWKSLMEWHDRDFSQVAEEPRDFVNVLRERGRRGLASGFDQLRRSISSVGTVRHAMRRETAAFDALDGAASPMAAGAMGLAPSRDSYVGMPAMDSFSPLVEDGYSVDAEEEADYMLDEGMPSPSYCIVDGDDSDEGGIFRSVAPAMPDSSSTGSFMPPVADPGDKARLSIRPWMPDTPYLATLDDALTADGLDGAREAYFSMRPEYSSSPSFFLDCSGWFVKHDDSEFGLSVLTNLAEIDVDNPAFLRMMGWRLREAGRLGDACVALRKVLSLRGEDSQSHRDLALTLSEMAKEAYATGDQEKAKSLVEEACRHYSVIITTPWARRAIAVALFAVEEMNVLRAWCKEQAWDGEAPATPSVTESLEGVLDCDLRITMAWDADDTDIDIHVTEPSGEEAYYGHRLTSSGGRVSEDITDGFGPELYEIRSARNGAYAIRAHYYASHQQTVFGPATCTLTIYTDWGRKEQRQIVTTTRLDKERSMIPVGAISYGSDATEAGGNPPESNDSEAGGRLSVGISEAEATQILGEAKSCRESGETRILEWERGGGRRLLVTFVGDLLVKAVETTPWGDETIVVQ